MGVDNRAGKMRYRGSFIGIAFNSRQNTGDQVPSDY
jgi:hypothetical protein